MNVFLLVVALAAPVEAPKVGLHEVAAADAAVASVQIVPEARGDSLAVADAPMLGEATASVATVANEQMMPEACGDPLAVADAPMLGEAAKSDAAKSGECLVSEATPDVPCALRASVSMGAANAAPLAEARKLAPLPEPKAGTGCDLVSLFATRRFLSAPWSASRRLKAARLRGDADEVRRMEARLGELVEEALGVEAEGIDDD